MIELTEGRRALLALTQTTTQDAIAERLGVTQSCVSRWCAGHSRPDRRARRAIAEAYGIPVGAWVVAPIMKVHARS